MPIYTDQLKRTVELTGIPKRIISLVPSQTELLFDLGLDAEVVGITKFCTHPQEWFRNKTRVGGTKTVSPDKVASLKPDLIIANKEENIKEQVEALEKIAPVWISDVTDIESAFDMMHAIGTVTGTDEKATMLIDQIKKDLAELAIHSSRQNPLRTAYLIWKDPYMAAGGDTFISDMLRVANCTNIFSDQLRYPEITAQKLKEMKPELVMLSSEPYPFKQKHIDILQEEIPGVKIILVDGEIFSWYGSRMRYAGGYIRGLFGY